MARPRDDSEDLLTAEEVKNLVNQFEDPGSNAILSEADIVAMFAEAEKVANGEKIEYTGHDEDEVPDVPSFAVSEEPIIRGKVPDVVPEPLPGVAASEPLPRVQPQPQVSVPQQPAPSVQVASSEPILQPQSIEESFRAAVDALPIDMDSSLPLDDIISTSSREPAAQPLVTEPVIQQPEPQRPQQEPVRAPESSAQDLQELQEALQMPIPEDDDSLTSPRKGRKLRNKPHREKRKKLRDTEETAQEQDSDSQSASGGPGSPAGGPVAESEGEHSARLRKLHMPHLAIKLPHGHKDASEVEAESGTETKTKAKEPGFFAKLMAALTEEQEEADATENEEIVKQLEAEDAANKSKKSKLKGKGKGRKAQAAGPTAPGDEDEDGVPEAKPAKPKKEKKSKKAKRAESEELPSEGSELTNAAPSRPLSRKSIGVIVVFAGTILAAILIVINLLSSHTQLSHARKAYADGDYMTCYEQMYGMKLGEEDAVMMKHCELVLSYRRRVDVHDKRYRDERYVEALDSLITAVGEYQEVYGEALECDAAAEISEIYAEITQILSNRYGLSQDEAYALYTIDNKPQYTRFLTRIVGATTGAGQQAEPSLPGPGELEPDMDDLLPEEMEMLGL